METCCYCCCKQGQVTTSLSANPDIIGTSDIVGSYVHFIHRYKQFFGEVVTNKFTHTQIISKPKRLGCCLFCLESCVFDELFDLSFDKWIFCFIRHCDSVCTGQNIKICTNHHVQGIGFLLGRRGRKYRHR